MVGIEQVKFCRKPTHLKQAPPKFAFFSLLVWHITTQPHGGTVYKLGIAFIRHSTTISHLVHSNRACCCGVGSDIDISPPQIRFFDIMVQYWTTQPHEKTAYKLGIAFTR